MDEQGLKKFRVWTLHKELGSGGNAIVWEATRDDLGKPLALKVVNTYRAGREPYRRFAREIEFLQSLDDSAGVMALSDAYLPENPTKDDPPWLAMPIATPIAEALAGQPFETVVSALAEIGDTLASAPARPLDGTRQAGQDSGGGSERVTRNARPHRCDV